MKTINIAIAAYNAEANIHRLVTSLLKQVTPNCDVEKIIVHSDTSSDNTVKSLAKIKSKKLLIIDSKVRRGFGGTVEYILRSYKADVTIILNDDIVIKDSRFVQKIANVFKTPNIGLGSVLLSPLRQMNFIQQAQFSAFKVYLEMRKQFPNKNNKYTCDGKVLTVSRQFANEITFPKDKSKIGNVDSYLYFLCLEKHFHYTFINITTAYFVFATSLKDYYHWAARGNSDKWLLQSRFGKLLDREYRVPTSYFIVPLLKEFIQNPLGLSFISLAGLFAKRKARKLGESFNPLWETISSTKQL